MSTNQTTKLLKNFELFCINLDYFLEKNDYKTNLVKIITEKGLNDEEFFKNIKQGQVYDYLKLDIAKQINDYLEERIRQDGITLKNIKDWYSRQSKETRHFRLQRQTLFELDKELRVYQNKITSKFFAGFTDKKSAGYDDNIPDEVKTAWQHDNPDNSNNSAADVYDFNKIRNFHSINNMQVNFRYAAKPWYQFHGKLISQYNTAEYLRKKLLGSKIPLDNDNYRIKKFQDKIKRDNIKDSLKDNSAASNFLYEGCRKILANFFDKFKTADEMLYKNIKQAANALPTRRIA
jgi:hypothetical protein